MGAPEIVACKTGFKIAGLFIRTFREIIKVTKTCFQKMTVIYLIDKTRTHNSDCVWESCLHIIKTAYLDDFQELYEGFCAKRAHAEANLLGRSPLL